MRLKHLAMIAQIWLVLSCKPTGKSKSLAIVSADGKNAVSLILMRNLYTPVDGETQSARAKSRIAESLRLQLGVVECVGDNAATRLNFLEALSFRNPDGVRRQKSNVYLTTTTSASLYESCKLVGRYTMGGVVLGQSLNDNPTNEEQFRLQQSIWLAMRGRSNMSTKTLSLQMWRFLEENLGATPRSNYQATSQRIDHLDRRFNPCLSDKGDLSFDKRKNFQCDQVKNYKVNGDFNSIKNLLVNFIDQSESAVDRELTRKFGANSEIAANNQALRLVESGLSEKFVNRESSTGGFGLKEPIVPKNSDALKLFAGNLKGFSDSLQVKIGQEPSVNASRNTYKAR